MIFDAVGSELRAVLANITRQLSALTKSDGHGAGISPGLQDGLHVGVSAPAGR